MNNTIDPRQTPMPADFICRKFHVSRVTLWRWRTAGLPTLKVGKKLFVKEADLVAFIETNGKGAQQGGETDHELH